MAHSLSRREFVTYGGVALGSALAGARSTAAAVPSDDPIWGTNGAATAIIRSLQHVSQTAFPATDFPVTRYGARPCKVVTQLNPYTDPPSLLSAGAERTTAPGSFDCQPAFLAAIAACHAAGGGRVLVPAGTWYCAGPIVLLSNVNFHLAANCTIYFSPNPPDYAKDGPVDCGANGRLSGTPFSTRCSNARRTLCQLIHGLE